ncbi:MAG: hypothetical protein Nk1A_6760 [Endomicrobiia bacterium]|nr:MAG: hypothetical protein Nk1A_6760 [Endomicrobiia bacterium]
MSKSKNFMEKAQDQLKSKPAGSAFISSTQEKEQKSSYSPPTKKSPKEIRSMVLHLLVPPSIYHAIRNQAQEEGLSTNGMVNQILKEHYDR